MSEIKDKDLEKAVGGGDMKIPGGAVKRDDPMCDAYGPLPIAADEPDAPKRGTCGSCFYFHSGTCIYSM